MRRPAAVTITLVVCLSSRARGGDDKKDSLTVIPWTDASLVFSTKDKNGVVEYNHLWAPYVLYLKASAPIDDDTRIGQFTRDTAGGFSISGQFGWDGRSEQLRRLEEGYKKTLAALKDVNLAKAPYSQEEFEQYITRHHIPSPTSSGIEQSLCNGSCNNNEAQLARAVSSKLPGGEATVADSVAVGAATELSNRELARCSGLANRTDADKDSCFLAAFWLREHAKITDISQATTFFTGATDKLWAAFETINPDDAKKMLNAAGNNKVQALIDNSSEVMKALQTFVRKAPLERRDLLMTGMMADQKADAQALTIDGHVNYDQLSVYQGDLASDPITAKKFDWSIGLNYTYYPAAATGLALNARVGYERSRSAGATKVERCSTYPSMDPTVSGKSCDADALFRAGDAPEAKSSAYVRVATTYQYEGESSEDDLVPGVEVRVGLEGLGGDKSVSTRITLFGTPIKGTTAARVGVALDAQRLIDTGGSTDSRWTFTPLFFVGATFSDLMSGSP
jgi:hypothetical protein